MKNLIYRGLCWGMTFGLVAVALGQQTPREHAMPLYPEWQPGQATSGMLPAPEKQQSGDASAPAISTQPPASDNSRRGELGVWMGDAGGKGVRILRVASGSAADKAGLQAGDVILQVNGAAASSPRETAQRIRQIAAGETGELIVRRDGSEQTLQISMSPARESAAAKTSDGTRQTAFNPADSQDTDLLSRTQRLEQQVNVITSELAEMRKELAQLRAAGPSQTAVKAAVDHSATPREPDRYNTTPTNPPATSNAVSPPPNFGRAEKDPVTPVGETSKPSTPPTPSTDIKPLGDPFAPPGLTPLKTDDKPKSDSDKGTPDDLFK